MISYRGHQICDNLSSNNCITLFPIYSSIIVSNELSPRFDSALSFPVNMYAKRNHSMVEVSFYVCMFGCLSTDVSLRASVFARTCVCVCVCVHMCWSKFVYGLSLASGQSWSTKLTCHGKSRKIKKKPLIIWNKASPW